MAMKSRYILVKKHAVIHDKTSGAKVWPNQKQALKKSDGETFPPQREDSLRVKPCTKTMQLEHQKQQKTQVQCTTDIVSSWRKKEAVAEEQYLNGSRMPVLPAELQTEHTLEFLWDELEVFLVYFHTLFLVP